MSSTSMMFTATAFSVNVTRANKSYEDQVDVETTTKAIRQLRLMEDSNQPINSQLYSEINEKSGNDNNNNNENEEKNENNNDFSNEGWLDLDYSSEAELEAITAETSDLSHSSMDDCHDTNEDNNECNDNKECNDEDAKMVNFIACPPSHLLSRRDGIQSSNNDQVLMDLFHDYNHCCDQMRPSLDLEKMQQMITDHDI